MGKRILVPLILVLAGAFCFSSCGTGGQALNQGVRIGPFTWGLPFVPAGPGQTVFVGFKNPTTLAAPVFVTVRTPAGAAYPGTIVNQPFTVPAQGELRMPLSLLTLGGTLGGWVCVETRNVGALDPATGEPATLATSGFIYPYIHRDVLGGVTESDALLGLTGNANAVQVALTPATDTIQLINYSYNQGPGAVVALPITYTVNTFNPAGVLINTTMVPVGANGSASFTPLTPVGSVRIAPTAGALPAPPVLPATQQLRFAVSTRENGVQGHVESRFNELNTNHLPVLVDYGFDVEFGTDVGGNVHDFSFLMSNPTGAAQTIVLNAVYRRAGIPLLTVPRAFILGAGRTVLMRTRTLDSTGLLAGEASFFDDIFGDVFTFGGFEAVTLAFQIPRVVDVSARHFDASFGSFYRIVRPVARTVLACVADLPIQVTTAAGTRNYVVITNTTANDVDVPIRGFTPALGTEYILDSVTVPAESRVDWSPDGMTFREVPTNPIGPPVPFMRFEFTPNTGIIVNSRTEKRDPLGLVILITPTAIRAN